MRINPYLKFNVGALVTGVDIAERVTDPWPAIVVTAAAAGINLGGLLNGAAGRWALVTIDSDSGSNTVQLDAESGAASAAARFVQTTLLGSVATARMGTLQVYDATTQRWRRAA
jgi:hypothetical protein